MNFFDHKDLGNHLLQLCPKVVKHPVYTYICISQFSIFSIVTCEFNLGTLRLFLNSVH